MEAELSLHRKLVLAFLVLALGPLVVAGLALSVGAYRLQDRQTEAIQRQVGHSIISEFRHYLGNLILELEEPLRRQGMGRRDAASRQSLADGLIAFEPMFIEVALLDAQGAVLTRASRYEPVIAQGVAGLGHLPEVAAAMIDGATAIGDIRHYVPTNEPMIGLVVPSMDPRTGRPEGFILAQARFRKIWEFTQPAPGLEQLNSYILDRGGQVIAHRNPSVVLAHAARSLPLTDGIVRGLDGDWVFSTSEAFVVGGRRFLMVVEQPLFSALKLPAGAALIVALVLLFAGIGAWFLMRYSRHAILAPIDALADAVRDVEAGDMSRRAPVRSSDEIGALAMAFNSMTGRVADLLNDLGDSEEKFRLVMESASDALVVIDAQGCITTWNRAATRMFGYQAAEVIGRNVGLLMPSHLRGRHDDVLAHLRTETDGRLQTEPREQPAQRKDGTLFPVEVTLAGFSFKGQRYFSGIMRDISARKEAESNIRFLARHDALTGLANRVVLREKLEEILPETGARQLHCLLFIDLDNFKVVNDILGHSFGDRLLVEVAGRLRSIEGGRNIVCRHGGDEFILLAPDIQSREKAAELAERVLAVMSDSFAIDAQAIEVGCSIGISMAPDDGDKAETLIRKADIAMYKAKEKGRLGFQFFTGAMDRQMAERRQLEKSLRRGLRDGDVFIHLQPKVRLAEGRVTGFEALARWQSPDHGMVPPSRFIPVAEECGLIGGIGELVLRLTMETLAGWRAHGRVLLPVAVNLSAGQLGNPGLAGEIDSLLREFGLPPTVLELELTESMLMGDADQVRAILFRLKDLGIKLSIDDFGTGYSSLSYLKRFPVDVLKIDKSFVTDLPGDPEGEAICLAIINMAKALSLDVVAEGVETEAQSSFLSDNGCDFAQGFFFARPVSVEEAQDYLPVTCSPDRPG
ncbi:diguanylate cyclase/phosphodiesterase (GGDEF & EAL domains) with PAS/PAC sensor(s) [Paramagnetospirillum magnetotacticum MS-1]|uniref:Diguanylate cyclase/phosphodiesterase (GGDEF & EAL domains) with PAS/PAC sensor(S) n=1 Tax=Paramagnetospirillum magnetotacticum MS-1 TaxID=272627 RepID=A0A0C2YJB7_PARME|nr:EAL domain-containing protein [Paramagnetospirillum magnetotacticum]KIL99879.1 diguanylate cyclase/phosphodiesterase (GGDEF & EAL domains) with PAS/PAC sensor(s) [Paramagnetospirillum magnetotacticum MS-1]